MRSLFISLGVMTFPPERWQFYPRCPTQSVGDSQCLQGKGRGPVRGVIITYHVHSGHSICDLKNITNHSNTLTGPFDKRLKRPKGISRWQLISDCVFRWCCALKHLIWIIMLADGPQQGTVTTETSSALPKGCLFVYVVQRKKRPADSHSVTVSRHSSWLFGFLTCLKAADVREKEKPRLCMETWTYKTALVLVYLIGFRIIECSPRTQRMGHQWWCQLCSWWSGWACGP